MPLQKFALLNTESKTPGDKNWRTFDQSSSTITRSDLVITDPAPVGTPTVPVGYFTLYGPIVFFSLRILLNNNDGWSIDASIELPYDILNTTTSKTGDVGGIATVFRSGGNPDSYATITIGNTLGFTAAYTNTSGVDQKVYVQGWYYRN